MIALDLSRFAVVGADPPGGLFLALIATLAALLLLAWRINRSERLLGRIARLIGLTLFSSRWHSRKSMRAKNSDETFLDRWIEILRKNVHIYNLLPPGEQERVHELIQDFLFDRKWEGCKGQPINDEVRVTIAGQACLLLLGRPGDNFDQVSSILVYPTGFRTESHSFLEEKVHTLGQAVYRGPVILAWDQVVAGGRNTADGHNVVFHEFAHQLDFAGDVASTDEGELARRRRRQEVFATEYERLVVDARHGWATLLDTYGATSPAEFFAVATECFFGRPIEMREQHPQLYDVLHEYYGQDSARRFHS